jgi:hypothetical protein
VIEHKEGAMQTSRIPVFAQRTCRVRSGLLVGAISCLILLQNAAALTYVVTSASDSGPESLRQSIIDANANTGVDSVQFVIPGPGPHTIELTTALPTITDTLIIDGYTQPGAVPATDLTPAVMKIALNGASTPTGTDGLHITAGGCTVRGLVIQRFWSDGIVIGSSGGNTVSGNYIGTDVTGTWYEDNLGNGVEIMDVPNNTIGGPAAEARNVIYGNYIGIRIYLPGAAGNVVQGNYIGIESYGFSGRMNHGDGIAITEASNNTVGGTEEAARNVICSCLSNGIGIYGSGANGNVVRGNYIGVNASGTIGYGHTVAGVSITNGSNNTVGGDTAGARNIIAHNGWVGVVIERITALEARGNVVQGNYIGTDVTGVEAIGNGYYGVLIYETSDNTVGGAAVAEGNRIAFNYRSGVYITGSAGTEGNAILSNAIYANEQLGIDLDPVGVTPNDFGDSDSGPNGLQNYPVLTAGFADEERTFVSGYLNSLPSASFTLQFFWDTERDPSGHGEGRCLLGETTIATNSTGNESFSVVFPTPTLPDAHITATATDITLLNTSEFSNAVAVEAMTLDGTIGNGTLYLTWSAIPGVDAYWVYGMTNDTYFAPELSPPYTGCLTVLPPETTSWTCENGIGDPLANWTYLVVAVNESGSALCQTNRVGEHDYVLID